MMTRFTFTAATLAALSLATACGGTEDAEEFKATSLALRADGDFKVGTTVHLQAVGIADGGKEKVLKSGVTFMSSNEQVATVAADGTVTMLAGGPVQFMAHTDSLEASLDARPTCDYPRFSPELAFNRIVPPLAWPAKWPDGTQFDFKLENVYCDADWKNIKTITFVVSAGWCTPCTLYAQRLQGEFEHLKELGMQIVIIEAQDVEGDPAHLDFAYSHVDRITDTIPGIVAGDADTQPTASYLNDSPMLTAFPTVFVVRTRDMRMIADQGRTNNYLPLEAIAADPEADWSNPGGKVFENNCAPGDEEATEPNDTPAQATPITAGTYEGGICTDAPDLYKVEIDGPWTLQLDFLNAVGDLDVFVWDEARNQPLQVNGQVVGSSGSTDQEKFEYSGRAVIAVQPFQHASVAYTLTLTEGN